ncbi:PQQ-dependent sugar dehydrogenase [Halococcus saccharolyticus]|uniref:Blue copper domain protein n=1 Tax=Halococcus saccharolyticus DSM 5350 TaxID=1227455 RepID=M0ME06_9EURY|nr:PQQ-dependent sugar dehydrogenase [Halococcus saccharolyticus]EMA43987.1 blue copper domain protein [Halococcus saccharolyticus DSM 5350]
MTGDPRNTDVHQASRRRFLGAAAAGALAGVGGLGSAAAQSEPEIIRLGGEIAGWQGRAPDTIAGETNPTLDLEPGTDYRVVWENLDGMGHNVALLDGDGATLERTEVMSEEGTTQSLTFTAREAMAEYICEPHSGTMRGALAVGEGSASETTTTTESPGDEAGSAGSAGGPVPQGPTIALETVADGFQVPTDFATAPGDDRQFVVDLPGQIYTVASGGGRGEPFLDISDRLAERVGERGLLGLAFHPDFDENRRFYLRYSAPLSEDAPDEFSHTERLSEFRVTEDATGVIEDSERVLLAVDEPTKFHNGGALAFGPDDYLYVSYGDGGGSRDTGPGHAADWYEENTGGNGQDVGENLLGSIVRIDVDGETSDKPYGIPEDNPLVGDAGLDEHYAWGFRNPWRMGFSDGDLYVADVGQSRFEEVDRVVKGGNYGWNVKEGTHCYSTANPGAIPAECPDSTPPDVRGGEPLRDPVIEYPHARDGETIGLSVIGGYVYDGAIGSLDGTYVFGDYSQEGNPQGSLFAATPSDEGLWEFTKLEIAGADDGELGGYLIDIGRDDAGELYALTSAGDLGGAVHKLVSADESMGMTGNTTTGTNGTTINGTATVSGTTTGAAETTVGSTDSPATGTTRETPTGTAGSATETTAMATETTATTTAGTNATPSAESTPGGTAEANPDGTSDAEGPGFGVLAALAGLAGVAARRFVRR